MNNLEEKLNKLSRDVNVNLDAYIGEKYISHFLSDNFSWHIDGNVYTLCFDGNSIDVLAENIKSIDIEFSHVVVVY